MPCKFCVKKPVITLINTNIRLCRNCFTRYFEKKILKTINKYDLLDNCKKIGVAVSGGKNSLIVLYILNKIAKQRISKSIKLFALHIDEGIKNFSERNNKILKEFCNKYNIELRIFPIKKYFRLPKKIKNPYAIYGSITRYLLNKKARELKTDRLATGHNLDSEDQSILMNQLGNNIERSSRLGVITGVLKDKRFIPRIKPLYFLTEFETKIYAKIKGFKDIKNPYKDSFRNKTEKLLNEIESKYPGTKYNIINSFLDVLPVLKEKYKTKIKDCKICGEPCSQDVCNVCKLIGPGKTQKRGKGLSRPERCLQ